MHNRERTLNSLFIAEEMRLESHILVLSLTNLTNMRSTILLTNLSIWALMNQLSKYAHAAIFRNIGSFINKSNGVRTIDAFSLVLVRLYHTFTYSFVLLLLKSSSNCPTFLFQTLIQLNFGQKQHFYMVSTRV